MLANSVAPQLEWLFQHISLIGWPAVVYIAWRASKIVTQITTMATKAVDQIDKMATNCFPTMQASLQNQDGLLHSMDGSLKTMVDKMQICAIRTARPSGKRKR